MFVTPASPPIQVYDRQQGLLCHEDVMSREWVDFLYTHPVGRLLEHYVLSQPLLSQLGGYVKARQGKKALRRSLSIMGLIPMK